MILFLYNALLIALLIIFSPIFILFFLTDFSGFRKRSGLVTPDALDSRKSILIHGASLGEMGIVRKLIPLLKKKYPDCPIVVSSTTLSGFRSILASSVNEISHAILLPLEFPFCTKRIFEQINPAIVIITETELWPNFIHQAKRCNARLVLVNGRLSDKSWPKYAFFQPLFKPLLKQFDAIGVQNELFRERFFRLGARPQSLSVTGNIKEALSFSPYAADARTALRQDLTILPSEKLFIAASTRPGEEELILDAFRQLLQFVPGVRLLIAPRHLSRIAEIEALINLGGFIAVRKTAMTPNSQKGNIILLDTLGELNSILPAADVAFVGGTLTDFGGHNLLEPLPFGVPVLFGPFTSTQQNSEKLILKYGCGLKVHDAKSLCNALLLLITDATQTAAFELKIKQLIQASGASLTSNLDLI